MPFQLSEKLYMLVFAGCTLVRNMLIYLVSHSFLYEFGDVAEVGHWSIILENILVKTSFFQQGCSMCSLKTGWELPSCREWFTIFVIGVKSTLMQSRTNDVGMGSRSHDLFGVDFMILRTSSSDMVRKETNLFL